MPFKTLNTENLTLLTKSKRSQSALEYMMTYGWAILIIVIVAVILYSMGIFNPSSSITTTSIGFSPFTVSSTVCSPAGLSVAIIGGGLPDTATQAIITTIYITSNTGTTALTKAYTLNPVTISPGKTATIVIPTVACTSANVKYSLSAKLQYSYSTPAGGVVTNTTGTIAGTSSSNPIAKYVPLTITSSAATPSPFQQMVVVNMNNYKQYVSSNLSNIEFTYPNGTIIPSWRENGTSNSQTVLYWLKLGSFTTTTVYMDFFSTSSNVLNTVNTGEAPQLSPTYAEYDDGANVFSFYDNFAGTTLSSKWVVTSGSVTVNNGLTLPAGTATNVGSASTFNPQTEIFDAFTYTNPETTGYSQVQWAGTQSDGAPQAGFNNDPARLYNYNGNSGNSVDLSVTPPNTALYVLSIWQTSSASYMLYNYGYEISNSVDFTSSTSQNLIFDTAVDRPELYVQWVRLRAIPPNSVMPSVTFGSVA